MSAREEQKRAAREERERVAARSTTRRRRLAFTGAVIALVTCGAVAFGLFSGSLRQFPNRPAVGPAPIPAPRTTDLDRAVRLAGARRISHPYAVGINDHTDQQVQYATNPPTNGPHAFSWAADGNYAGMPAPPTEQVVHAQEHGRVVLQYRRGLPRRTVRQIVALFEESPLHVLLIENATGMPCDVAATAWGQAVLCPRVNKHTFDALRAFRHRFRDQGPEYVALRGT